tara:strand:- start:2399 stop:3496 length:1098 start_codon:yes stop_codon:yes gene_type:complete
LKKRGVSFDRWSFPSISQPNFSSIIIIPSYSESKYIINTLDSLNQQLGFDFASLLVVVVINNSDDESADIVDDNLKTAQLINNYKSKYTLIYIDAFSNKNALPIKSAGVGYARKIGMDFALKHSLEDTVFYCLDADTVVSNQYLSKISLAYKQKPIKALLVDFEHQENKNKHLTNHIRDYEVFLKETAMNIDKTGSPYGYVSLGPTITCLADTYVKVGGMVNKKATEDFYFLQQIRKFSEIYFLDEKLVFPSSRISNRVYLGTGYRMNELIKGQDIKKIYYSKESYKILKKTIYEIISSYKKEKSIIRQKLLAIDDKLDAFFLKEGFFDVWDNINSKSNTIKQFELQFHKWFDNLKTLRLLKFYS